MGLGDKLHLLEWFKQQGWHIADEETFFVRPSESFWNSIKSKEFHVYHAITLMQMLSVETPQDERENEHYAQIPGKLPPPIPHVYGRCKLKPRDETE